MRLMWISAGFMLGWLTVAQGAERGPDAAERAAEAIDARNAEQLEGAHMTPASRAAARRNRGSGTPPGMVAGPDNRASQRAVCQAQCNLERMACDQGRDSFRNRSDQIQSWQSSCYLAVSSCLSRC